MSLLNEILALDPELVASRNDVAIAAALSVGRTRLVPTEIGNGLVLATVGLEVGNALLDALNTLPDYRYVKPLLEQGRLDISTPLARGGLDALVGNIAGFTQARADALKALAERPDPVSDLDVRKALWDENGNWLGGE